MITSATKRRVFVFAVVGVAVAIGSSTPRTVQAASYGGTAMNGYSAPVLLPSSGGTGEPSLAIDSQGRRFVTAPQGIVVATGGSPVWRSTDGGQTWLGPVRAPEDTGLSGEDTDITTDGQDNVWQTDLWIGNSSLALSTDHGQTFTANPYGSQDQPGDDRPWIVYDKVNNQIEFVWDGLDALHVSASAPLVTPQDGLQVVQDVAAVPECVLNACSGTVPNTTRVCVCPPGGIASDPNTGEIFISFSHQNGGSNGTGEDIARCMPTSGLLCAPVWSQSFVPGAGSTGSSFDTEWNFSPIKVDSAGNVYVAWAEIISGSVAIRYSFSTDHGVTWHNPVLVSTSTTTNVFPTMAVPSPGHVDIAYYGTTASGGGDPNTVSGPWNIYVASSTNGTAASPTFSPVEAIAGMHTGVINSGGSGSGDRSLLDFFSLVDDCNGNPNIIYTGGDANAGASLYFTKIPSTVPCSVTTPEAPWTPLLLVVPGSAAVAIGARRLRRREAPAVA